MLLSHRWRKCHNPCVKNTPATYSERKQGHIAILLHIIYDQFDPVGNAITLAGKGIQVQVLAGNLQSHFGRVILAYH